ncbi:radical SAM family heme chaperone HemW [Pseudotabrizicola sp. L79]|uniref:radical SAM family heme chaperone HemW n=1 Tax=Pseudotabrizicola sp. L79 TaxID=3118402 RepID=UPI002F95A520
MERWQVSGFGLYVHWPFCQSKCPYCDFNSHIATAVDEAIWKGAMIAELRRLRLETGTRALSSIFFGGGTPSLMSPNLVEAIISEATSLWPSTNDIEITLEANPTSAEVEKFKSFRTAGVNRVSIGVQALDDASLRQLGRMHDTAGAYRAIDMAQSVFDRFSFDLIYARQNQSLADWERELQQAIAIGPRHLSLYQLTVEPGTVFGARHAKGHLRGLPSDDLGADMYSVTQGICEDHGLEAYETSNHATAGQESRHNLLYWKSGDFAAIGPGSHGRLTAANGQRRAFSSHLLPETWLKAVDNAATGEVESAVLTDEEVAEEFLVMGLRLRDGICLTELLDLTGFQISAKSIKEMQEMCMIELVGQNLKTTVQGRALLNSILTHLELERPKP